jgi:hypothetical protein
MELLRPVEKRRIGIILRLVLEYLTLCGLGLKIRVPEQVVHKPLYML